MSLQSYGVAVGLRMLGQAPLMRTLRYLIVPVNYWRELEYELALTAGAFTDQDRVLDVGSPKLLALYLAERVGASVVATDIERYFLDEYSLLRRLRGIPASKLELGVEDGRKLTFADGSFDKAYSISVLEHIPDGGDAETVKELARVLKTPGRCLITVPFWPTSRVDYRDDDFYWSGASSQGGDGRTFFQRRYSESDLHERLINPSGLRLARLSFVGEKMMAKSSHELCEYMPPPTGPIQPFLSRMLLTAPVERWQDLRKPLCALIVLEK